MSFLDRFRAPARPAAYEAPARGLKSVSVHAAAFKERGAISSIALVRDSIKAHQEWQDAYETTIGGGIVDAETNDLFAQGYAITGTDDNKQAEQVSNYLDKTDFDLALRTIVTQARIHMYGVAEVSKDEIGRFKMVAVPSVNLVPTYGEDGWLDGFAQYGAFSKKVSALKLSDLVVVNLTPPTGGQVGVSQIGRNIKSLRNHEDITQASADMIWQHGYPHTEVEFHPEDGAIPDVNAMNHAEGQLAALGPGANFASAMDTAIKQVDSSVPQIQAYGDWCLQEIAAGFGIPRAMVGLIDNSEATATVTRRMYLSRIASEQLYIEREVNRHYLDAYVLPALGLKPGSVKLDFNDPDPDAMSTKADLVTKLVAINASTDQPIYSTEELAQMLGKQVKQGEYDDDSEVKLKEVLEHLADAKGAQ